MSLRNLLGLNVDVVDAYLIGNISAFYQHPIKRITGFVRGDIDVSPVTNVSAGGTFEFNLPRTADICGRVVFCANAAALASGSATGDFPRWRDAFTYQLITQVVVAHESNPLQTLAGDAIYMFHKAFRSSDDSYDALSYSGLQTSTATRAALAAAAVEIYVDLPLCWTLSPDTYIPINQDYVRGNINLRVTTKTVQEVSETNGDPVTGGTLSNVRLRCEYFWLNPNDHAALYAEQQSVSMLTQKPGWARMVGMLELQRFTTLTTGTTEQEFSLTNRGPVREIVFGIVPSTNRVAAGVVANHYGYTAVGSWRFRGVSTDIVQSRTGLYSKEFDMLNAHSANPTENLYGRAWALNAEMFSQQVGYINFNPIPDRRLVIAPAASAAGQVDCLVHYIGVLVLSNSGDFYMMYAV